MDSKGFRSIIDLIREASGREILLVALLITPFYLSAWAKILDTFAISDKHQPAILGVVTTVFWATILFTKWPDPLDERYRRAARHVKNFLERQKQDFRSYEAIRRLVDEKYTDEFLKKLIERNPDLFRRTRIKSDTGPKDAIGLVRERIEETETAVQR